MTSSLVQNINQYPKQWEINAFSKVIRTITPPKKLKKKETMDSGRYPVIDQGNKLISGYCDNSHAVILVDDGLVIFGDHTRKFKYIDFDFVAGADGTKVLKPDNCLVPKYLYYFLETLDIPDTGYNRHYKYLKDVLIPTPKIDIQKKIVEILDQADELRRKREESIKKLEELEKSIFLDMFGDPVTNPKKWNIKKFEEIGILERGKSKHRPRNAPELLGGKYPLIQTGDVSQSNGLITKYSQTYSDFGLKQSRLWPSGTLCITIAANIAETGILAFDACFPDSVVGFTPNKETASVEYIQTWLSFLQQNLEANAPQASQKNINLKILRDLPVPTPPVDLVVEYTSKIDLYKKQLRLMKDDLDLLENLFNCLLQKAFKGELVKE